MNFSSQSQISVFTAEKIISATKKFLVIFSPKIPILQPSGSSSPPKLQPRRKGSAIFHSSLARCQFFQAAKTSTGFAESPYLAWVRTVFPFFHRSSSETPLTIHEHFSWYKSLLWLYLLFLKFTLYNVDKRWLILIGRQRKMSASNNW